MGLGLGPEGAPLPPANSASAAEKSEAPLAGLAPKRNHVAHGYGLRSSSLTPSVHSHGSAATAGACLALGVKARVRARARARARVRVRVKGRGRDLQVAQG